MHDVRQQRVIITTREKRIHMTATGAFYSITPAACAPSSVLERYSCIIYTDNGNNFYAFSSRRLMCQGWWVCTLEEVEPLDALSAARVFHLSSALTSPAN